MRTLAAASGVLALALACACSDVQQSGLPDPSSQLDETVFKCSVEPILARQCSYNACHGQAQAALRVYTPGKLRDHDTMDIDAKLAPLTPAEEHGNFTSASGFAATAASIADNFLLRKPLPAGDGGFEHKGGAIWSGSNDPQYQAIAAWLGGTGRCP